MSGERVLGVFDAPRLRVLFAEAGVFEALAGKGFADVEVVIEAAGHALPHVYLFGTKAGTRVMLLDARLGEATVREDYFRERGFAVPRAVELAVVHWFSEQNPTARFDADRPPLPLQRHPGLGVLRRAFRTAVRISEELGKDGVVNVPKFFHDALIFFRSRLFLFLDGREQGEFEALARDLAPLRMGDASLALISGAVRSTDGHPARWNPGYQVYPVSALLTAYFHSECYAAAVEGGRAARHCVVDARTLAQAKTLLAAGHTA